MRQASVFVALSALGLAAAQNSNFTVDPNTIDTTTRNDWCNGELNTCSILCGGRNKANTCNPSDLKFVCTCSSNNSAPGLEYYQQSMPTYLCDQAFKDCIAKNVGNALEQGKCTTDIKNKCGTLDPAEAKIGGGSSSPSSSSSAAAPTGSPTGTTNAAPSSSTSVGGALPTMVGNGLAAVAAGVLAAALL